MVVFPTTVRLELGKVTDHQDRFLKGMQPNQQVDFLSDGGEDVRNLQLYLNPQAEHLLDWFHLTMRLTVLNQTAKGLPERVGEGEDQYELRAGVLKDLERIKWCLKAKRLLPAITSKCPCLC